MRICTLVILAVAFSSSAQARCKSLTLEERAGHADTIYLAAVVAQTERCIEDPRNKEPNSEDSYFFSNCSVEVKLTVQEIFKGTINSPITKEYPTTIIREHDVRPKMSDSVLVFENSHGWNSRCSGTSVLNEYIQATVLPQLRAMKSNKSFKEPAAARLRDRPNRPAP